MTEAAGTSGAGFSLPLLIAKKRITAFFAGHNYAAREVVKAALASNAAAVIFAHNHPSGVAQPSQADELITRRLKEALALVDIRVLDHVIVAGGDLTSFAEKGLI